MDSVRTVTLEWQGPFQDTSEFPNSTGIYAVTGLTYGSEAIRLLYIGKAENSISHRWTDARHRQWLSETVEHMKGSVYFATTEAERVDAVESLLIYVHQPNQNSSKLGKLCITDLTRYVVHNTHQVPEGMLPVVDSAFPWFGIPRES